MDQNKETLLHLQLAIQKQHHQLQQLVAERNRLQGIEEEQNKSWQSELSTYKNSLMSKQTGLKKSKAIDYVKQRLYEQGINHKVEKIINEINNIVNSRNHRESRKSLEISDRSFKNYKKIIVADKYKKNKQEECKLLAEIQQLEKQMQSNSQN